MITLITGGERSGKSKFAETLLSNENDVVYIATAENTDAEMDSRITQHKKRRNPNWRTYENYKNFSGSFGNEKYYLLDCITNSISRLLFEVTGTKTKITNEDIERTFVFAQEHFSELLTEIKKRNANLIAVTNEVGSSIIPMHPVSRAFVDLQGMVNAWFAEQADCVYLCVAGIPLKIKCNE
ncbi:MAG: bifunctional adenosylcobinamide kinase/adenosylcobinamide-phosphate guanylyltransferase [Treponema sp.]|nr:MAG: bifunctional adenosylcobinamide kinase/adenosylcobinamide-phosphate guanylyltransferase [Treponema sp.]